MIRKILILLSLLNVNYVLAQTVLKHNTIYFELGGNGLMASIHYERQIVKRPHIGVHAGIGSYGIKDAAMTLPVGINYLLKIRKSESGFEFGLGITYTKTDVTLYAAVERYHYVKPKENFFLVVPAISYRAQSKKGIMFRIGFTPVITYYAVLPYAGFSFGKSF